MAEVATGVLHNVGNVLNSVNISSGCVIRRVKNSKVANLTKVAAMLGDRKADLCGFITNDPRGKHLPDYLAQLAEHLSREQAETIKELGHLQDNIEHIKDIVTMQQSFAKVCGVAETLMLSDLVEDALRMNTSALARYEIDVIREFAETPMATLEKHKVLQILVNLVRNAEHACNDSGRTNKRLTVRIENGDGRVRVSVSDNGVGIPPENLTRIFNHGFTTKKNGHGFGLHSGALAAKEMGGSLSVHSEGAGQCATCILDLPLERKRNGHA
jgi:signal transduction histidine kinase